MKKIYLTLTIVLVAFNFGYFDSTHAQAKPGEANYHILIPCEGKSLPANNQGYKECDFDDFVNLVNRIINLLFFLAVILATISFIYCGFLFLTAGGDAGKAKQAKEIFYKVVIGFLWIFGAWLIVHFITGAFGLLPEITLIN